MRNELPNSLSGCGVINLDDSRGPGTHWTAWFNNIYFDSYGLPPPEEFLDRTRGAQIKYNDLDIQKLYDPPWCGHLCLGFLHSMANGENFNSFAMRIYRI